jgi:hypothetical protein
VPKTQTWEALGQLLTAGAAIFGLIYTTPGLASISGVLRGAIIFSTTPAGALGSAGLAFSSLGSFVGILLGELRQPNDNIGAALLFWVDFAVLVIGAVAFYSLSFSSMVVLLIGGASAVLTAMGLLIIIQRQRR